MGQELGGNGCTAAAPAAVLDIGEATFDQLVIGWTDGQVPDLLPRRQTGLLQLLGKGIGVGEQPRIIMAERNEDGAGQGRDVDHGLRRELLAAIPECVGKNETAFGVGRNDLDGFARHGRDDVAGTVGIAVRHVLGQCQNAHGIDLCLALGKRLHQPHDRGGTGHVAFHVFHRSGGFDRDATGVEDDALADKGNGRFVLAPAVPAHDHQTRRAHRALPHREKRAHLERLHFLFSQNLDRKPALAEALRGARHIVWTKQIGRLIDEIASEDGSVGDGQGAVQGLLGLAGIRHHEGEVETPAVRSLLSSVILVEAVGAELGSPRECGDQGRLGFRLVHNHARLAHTCPIELGKQRATAIGPGGFGLPFALGAASQDDQPVETDSGGRGQIHHVARPPGKAGDARDMSKIKPRPPPHILPQLPQRSIFISINNKGLRRFRRILGKAYRKEFGHEGKNLGNKRGAGFDLRGALSGAGKASMRLADQLVLTCCPSALLPKTRTGYKAPPG